MDLPKSALPLNEASNCLPGSVLSTREELIPDTEGVEGVVSHQIAGNAFAGEIRSTTVSPDLAAPEKRRELSLAEVFSISKQASAAGWFEPEKKRSLPAIHDDRISPRERETSESPRAGEKRTLFAVDVHRQKPGDCQPDRRQVSEDSSRFSFGLVRKTLSGWLSNHPTMIRQMADHARLWKNNRLSGKGILLTEERKKMRAVQKRKHVYFRLSKKRNTEGFHLLSHDSPFFDRWQRLMVVMMAYEIWAFPFRLALVDRENAWAVLTADSVADLAFLLDMGFRLCTKVPAGTYPHQEEELQRPREIAAAYLRHVFPLEILPSLLYYPFTALLLKNCDNGICWGWWALMVPRLVPRAHRMSRYFAAMEKNLQVSVRAIQGVRFSLILFLSAHWVGCLFFWLARLNHLNEDTWIAQFQSLMPFFSRHEASLANLYLVCLYRGFNALANLGYDQDMPSTASELIFSIIVMAFQVYLSALVLGTLLNYLVAKDRMAEAHKKQLEQVEQFAVAKSIPSDLRDKIYKYMQFQYEKNVQNKATVAMTLPKSLEIKVADAKYRSLMDKCSRRGGVFHQCDANFLNSMLVKLRVLHVMPGEEFVSKSEIPRELYFVLHGTVHLIDDENRVKRAIRHDVPDMAPLCGEVPFFLGLSHVHSLRAKADEDVKLLVLAREDSDELSLMYPEEYELIHENLLFAQGLDVDGNELSGAEATAEKDRDKAVLKESILLSIRRREQERFASLIFATTNGDVETVLVLARQGVNINEVDHDGRTILHMAAMAGNYKLVETLIDLQADLNICDRWGQTPLAEAIAHKQALIANLLAQHKATLSTQDPGGQLCQASASGDLEAVKRLVENSVDPSFHDYDKRRALHTAAAEGQLKIVEYLLNTGTDPNPRDRWNGTPLQDAVRGGYLAVAAALRAKGGELPAGVGAEQVHQAAAAGDVRTLRLLHECGVSMEEADYDSRFPLHLAAAEGRVLAVSYLLGLSANPNVKDRWGGTPLDDALEGGTLYHTYCAKLIAGWGGRSGRTVMTAEQKQALEDLEIEEVRALIKKLITAGYDSSTSKRLTKQDLCVAMDASVLHIPVVHQMFERVTGIKTLLSHNVSSCRGLVESLKDSVRGIATSLDSKRQPVGRRRSMSMIQKMPSVAHLPSAPQPPSTITQTLRFLDKLDHILDSESGVEEDEMEVEELWGESNGVDSDEEAVLYAEVDLMAEAQERAMEAGVSGEKLAAKSFQKVAMKIVEVSNMFRSMCRVAEAAVRESAETTLDEEPWLTADDLWVMLDLLHIDNIQNTEVEDVLEEAHLFHSTHASARARQHEDNLRKDTLAARDSKKRSHVHNVSSRKSSDRRLLHLQSTNKQPSDKAIPSPDVPIRRASSDASVGNHDALRLPISSVLAGSPRFRRMLSALSIDADLCALLNTKLATHLSEGELRQLLPCQVSKCCENDTLLDSTVIASTHVYVLISGECSISFDNEEIKAVAERLHAGDFFGGHWALSCMKSQPMDAAQIGSGNIKDPASGFAVRAISPCEFYQLSLDQVLSVVDDISRAERLAAFMAEAPQGQDPILLPAPLRLPTAVNRLESGGSSEVPDQLGPTIFVGELERQAMKGFVCEMDELWASLSVGSSTVFRKQLFMVADLLGEASSELFRTMFLSQQIPVCVTPDIFWRCNVSFLADELFGDGEDNEHAGTSLHDGAVDGEDEGKGFNPDDHDEENEVMELEDEPAGLMKWIQSVIEGSHSLRHRFFEPEALDLYKEAWLDVVRDTSNPLPVDKIPVLLARVFIDYEHPITKRTVKEFLIDVGKEDAKILLWHDVHKVLCDYRLGLLHVLHGPLIGSALNPTWHVLHKWQSVIRLCATYYLVMVPVRIAFLPYDFLDQSALCSDLIVDALVFLDLLVRLNTAYRTRRSTWTTKRLKILRKLPIPAILAPLPFDWAGYLCGASNELACWLRMPKLLLALVTMSNTAQGTRSAQREKFEVMVQVVAMMLHCSACMWHFLGRVYGNLAENELWISWNDVAPAAQDMTFDREDIFGLAIGDTVWEQYLVSLYWVTATLTVSGLVGPVLPQNLVEVFFTILLLVLNLTVVRAVLGEVSSMIMSADKEIVSARERLELVDSFVLGNELPRDLQQEIRDHFQTVNNGNALDQCEVLPFLSRSLQLQVASVTCREHLEVEFLRGVSPLLRDSIGVLLRELTFAPSQNLFFEAHVATDMFFLVSGVVEEYIANPRSGDVKVEDILRAPAAVGGLAFYFGVRHYCSARAGRSGAVCLALERSKFLGLMKLFPEESEVVAQNSLRIMEKLNASSRNGSRSSKASRARSTRSGKSNRSSVRSMPTGGSEAAGSIASGNSRSAEHSDLMEQGNSGSGGTDKIATLKTKRKMAGMLAFLRECRAGNLEAVQKALDLDVHINDVDQAKRSALHVAASEGHDDLVRFLLEAKGDMTLKDARGNTPLNDAVRHHRDSTCQLLREYAPEISLSLPGKVAAAEMCQAAFDGDVAQLKRLLQNGVPIDDVDYDGRSALHLASCEGHVEVVKVLLESKASVAGADRFGGTAMEDAVRHRQVEVQDLLREHGARLEMSGRDYSGKLCEAAANGDLETIQILGRNGVDLLASDYDGRTALHLAAANERVAVLEFLLSYQPPINLNPLDRFGDTPLGDAVRHERHTAISMLSQVGAVQKGDSQLLEAGSRERATGTKRQKMLREPAVAALMDSSLEQRALAWVEKHLEPALNQKTRRMLESVDSLSTALQQLTEILQSSHADRLTPKRELEMKGNAEIGRLVSGGGGNGGNGERLVAKLRGEMWQRAHGQHLMIKDRAEEVLELAQEVRQQASEAVNLLVLGDQEADALIPCPIWAMASRKFAKEAAEWERCGRVVSALSCFARRLMKEIVRAQNRKARAALDNTHTHPI